MRACVPVNVSERVCDVFQSIIRFTSTAGTIPVPLHSPPGDACGI